MFINKASPCDRVWPNAKRQVFNGETFILDTDVVRVIIFRVCVAFFLSKLLIHHCIFDASSLADTMPFRSLVVIVPVAVMTLALEIVDAWRVKLNESAVPLTVRATLPVSLRAPA